MIAKTENFIWLNNLLRGRGAKQIVLILDAAGLDFLDLFDRAILALARRRGALLLKILVQVTKTVLHSLDLVLVSNHL